MDVIHLLPLSKSSAFDALSYPAHFKAKLAELRDFVETNLETANAATPSFAAGDPVSTAGKLYPKLEGQWVIKSVKSPINIKIDKGRSTKVVHTNCLPPRSVPTSITSPQPDPRNVRDRVGNLLQ